MSGGFDPPHIGHVRLFKEARKLGDKLVVILNNDNWLKAKKGYVFMPEHERKELIESFVCVDKVILTNHASNPKDMSVCKELQQLKPHIFANGGDRNKKNVPEVAACNSIKCKMIFNIGPGGKIQSSSWLLENFGAKAILNKMALNLAAKKILVFDLDGTLAQSKAALDKEMAQILYDLLSQKTVVIVSGCAYAQFEKQFFFSFKYTKKLENLFLLPTSGSSFYHFRNREWQPMYQHLLTLEEKKGIKRAFKEVFREIGYQTPQKIYGQAIEDRGSQITFSALGQKAPLAKKREWHTIKDRRNEIREMLAHHLPQFEIRLGGLTSIDVTPKGIDKGYAVEQILKTLHAAKDEIVFIGDALYEGGNDFPVLRTGIDTVEVSGPEEVKYFIRSLLTANSLQIQLIP